MDFKSLVLVIMVMVAILASSAVRAASSPGSCRAFQAVRGAPLRLPCGGVSGCLTGQRRWFHISGNTREEIDPESGRSTIDPTTGELSVTESASSEVGGQTYQCQCGAESSCYIIHVPPQVSILLTPPDAAVGEHVTITCTSYGGYPQPPTITFTNSSGIMALENGQPYHFQVRRLEDGGLVRCILSDVTTQPSMSATLSVYHKPHVAKVQNATVVRGSGSTAAISCSVHTTHCRTVVKFFKDGREIQDTEKEFARVGDIPRGNDTFTHYLIISDVSDEVEGRYICRVYANYTTLVPVSEQELFVHSFPPPTLDDVQPDVEEANTDSPDCDCVSKNVVIGAGVVIACVLFFVVGAVVLYYIWRARNAHDQSASPV